MPTAELLTQFLKVFAILFYPKAIGNASAFASDAVDPVPVALSTYAVVAIFVLSSPALWVTPVVADVIVPSNAPLKVVAAIAPVKVAPVALVTSTSELLYFNLTIPVPFGFMSIFPLVSVDVIALPFILILSTSRSVLITTVPVPFGDRFMLPFVSVEDIVFVSTLRLPTLMSPLTSTPSAVVSIFFTLLWHYTF